jgi:prevent-host-death family protein
MKTVGMFKTKTHLTDLIKQVESGEEICITNRGREVAFIIPVGKYYSDNARNIFKELSELKKRVPLGDVETILEMKNYGRK